MVFRKQMASCEEAKNIDMVSYLSSLGYEPAKVQNIDYWYLSPLRNEKTPSFKVNRKLNRWYDHGLGKGGNLIDFAILYNNCTVGEFLRAVHAVPSLHQPDLLNKTSPQLETAEQIKILDIRPLSSFALCRYLRQRRIPFEIAGSFCREVTYELNQRRYFAIGFKNDVGGYELRNAFFKGSSAPKSFTSIAVGANEVAVFEGFFDFLSFMAIATNQQLLPGDFLVLNSLSFFEKARSFMEKHDCINLFLDQDKTGQNCTRYALSLSEKYRDKSSLYKYYKDFNDWMVNIGKSSPDYRRQ
ncbi:toprim domain-containing protein [Paracnuella aquatica]|uniref:toprim domain-containing protein n=1 Tax=Paracnuella aquatica TaxID=2268757 RepID=UPI000DEEF587|nr:toprim domain-containing protein [Paracnuella aquatica]RPD44013.1 DNA primase [Paracnuella aquatica]